MRIAFILIGNSRRSNYLNGDTLRYGQAGGSGTDTSTILVAEYLASQGHEVVVATDKLEPAIEKQLADKGIHFPKGTEVRGVKYTDIEFNFIENKSFDILVNSLWFSDYKQLPITVSKSLIYWCHMQWIYGIEEMICFAKENNLSLGFVNISLWERQMNNIVIEHAKQKHEKTLTTLISNPVCDDIIKQVLSENIVKKPHKFIFHASWARGGNVAVEAISQLKFPDKELHAFDYLITIHDHQYPFFKRHDSADKYSLFKHLAESEYFLYPLYTPYKDVHKDTFSCVVAEAIALGAIPITYPLGALPENFTDFCAWIPFPEKANSVKMQAEPLSRDEDGLFENNISNILETINNLETNKQFKEKIKLEGCDFITKKFNVDTIGKQWVEFINTLTQ